VGAGCGSGTLTLLEELAGTPAACYVASDISPSFLRRTRARLEEAGKGGAGLELRLLDLNRPRSTWRLAEGDLHLVFGVNVLHCVRDLVATLADLRLLLRPGGRLVLGECLRPARGRPVHPEFIFQLLDEFRHVVVHPAHRPGWGFLDASGWRGALAEAGFREIVFLPDVEAVASIYPGQSIAAILARA
jgi:SAM-dependent methyltransferase